MEGNSKGKSLVMAGGKETTAYHDIHRNVLVKTCEVDLERQFKESDITVQFVLNNLIEDRQLAMTKKDYSTVVKVDELLGKYITMFKVTTINTTIYNVSGEATDLIASAKHRLSTQPKDLSPCLA